MRRIILIFLAFLVSGTFLPGAVHAAISTAPIQQVLEDAGQQGSQTTTTITLTSTPTQGNTIILVVSGANNNTVSAVSQTNVTWTKANSLNASGNSEIWYGTVGASAGTVISLTNAPLTANLRLNATEWSGIATVSPLLTSGTNNGNSTAPVTASITPTANKNVLIISTMRLPSATTAGPTAGFTALSSGTTAHVSAYNYATTTSGSYSNAYTITSGVWIATIAAFVSGDVTVPVISSVSPATGAFINNATTSSDISYTLSEALLSGSITITRTSGNADASSPRTCTLKGTALNAGAHTIDLSDTTNGCTSNVSNLVSGTVYTFAFAGTDTSNNAATTVTSTSVTFDNSVPAAPGTPDLTTATDSGVSSTDDITGDTTPDFTVSCESSATVTLMEGAATLGTGSCSSSTVTITSSILSEGAHSIKALQTDQAGNVSSDSSTLSVTIDSTAPTITNVTSDTTNGHYSGGEVIDIDITFSEAVTSSGNVTVTLETGVTDRTCTFTVSNSATASCEYTVRVGDSAEDLNVSSISGTLTDGSGSAMLSFAIGTNLESNKNLIIDTSQNVPPQTGRRQQIGAVSSQEATVVLAMQKLLTLLVALRDLLLESR